MTKADNNETETDRLLMKKTAANLKLRNVPMRRSLLFVTQPGAKQNLNHLTLLFILWQILIYLF